MKKLLHTQRAATVVLALTTLCGASWAQASCPATTDPIDTTRWRLSADGSEVTDQTTGLVWARCSVGQVWNNTAQLCATSATDSTVGAPTLLTFSQAFATARDAVDASGNPGSGAKAWRVPTARELFSLVNPACSAPAIDSNVFKNVATTGGGAGNTARAYWSSTPIMDYLGYTRIVVFGSGGHMSGNNDSGTYAVRLVRADQ